ncbi:hypothetical protein TPELB_33190 [Terrisporobacter petrolearius]|uniref:Uncharacterized protein n=1 Tax=Terrisporobacter petrolearius TaxID=1460447 RepID=A0ABZ3FJZ8_9FIRM
MGKFCDNISGGALELGESKDISLIINNRKYDAIISNANRKDRQITVGYY